MIVVVKPSCRKILTNVVRTTRLLVFVSCLYIYTLILLKHKLIYCHPRMSSMAYQAKSETFYVICMKLSSNSQC